MAVIVVWVCEAVKVWLSAAVCCCFTDGRVSDFGDLGFWLFYFALFFIF
ncbi:hypothetical protein AB3S75_045017 [Citrus x aurantiifolia]